MSNALQIIGDNIATWWQFLVDTNVPGTTFSFASLYMFLFIVSIFVFIVHIVTGGGTQGGAADTRREWGRFLRRRRNK